MPLIDARLVTASVAHAQTYPAAPVESRCAVRRGRRDRHSGSRVLRSPAAESRPAVHGREPRRRGRPDRRGGGRPLARRWLDPDVHHRRADHHRAADERQGAVRSAQGLRADCRGRGDAGLAGGERELAAQVRWPTSSSSAKDKPGKLNYGTSGVGTELHLAAEAVSRSAGNPDGACAVPRRRRGDRRAARQCSSTSPRSAPPRSPGR